MGTKMTRSQFELIASLLKESYSLGVYRSEKGFVQCVVQWADQLEDTNPMFNRHSFLKACGVI